MKTQIFIKPSEFGWLLFLPLYSVNHYIAAITVGCYEYNERRYNDAKL